jgi:5-formyltetrahydrofolate cyclo-ligase
MRTELDPLPLLEALIDEGFSMALPVVQAKGAPLVFRCWRPDEPTVQAGFGTREPPAHHAIAEPDILLVPLLAFDRLGYRLGYGGGFYDRTLNRLRALRKIHAIGLAFDEQEIDAVPRLDYDQRLDGVLTPSGLRLMPGPGGAGLE